MKRLFQQVRFFLDQSIQQLLSNTHWRVFDSSKYLYVYNIGLHAAYTLAENGVKDIVVLEAQDRIGGRIYSSRINGSNGNWIERGAQWIHGDSNESALWRFVLKHKVQIFSGILD